MCDFETSECPAPRRQRVYDCLVVLIVVLCFFLGMAVERLTGDREPCPESVIVPLAEFDCNASTAGQMIVARDDGTFEMCDGVDMRTYWVHIPAPDEIRDYSDVYVPDENGQ